MKFASLHGHCVSLLFTLVSAPQSPGTAQRFPEILQLNRDSHFIGILSKARCTSAVQTGHDQDGYSSAS